MAVSDGKESFIREYAVLRTYNNRGLLILETESRRKDHEVHIRFDETPHQKDQTRRCGTKLYIQSAWKNRNSYFF